MTLFYSSNIFILFLSHFSPELLNLKVRRIYSVICHHGMKPTNETFRSMISLCVKMKDVSFYLASFCACKHTHGLIFPFTWDTSHSLIVESHPKFMLIFLSNAVWGCIWHAEGFGENEFETYIQHVQCYNGRIFSRGDFISLMRLSPNFFNDILISKNKIGVFCLKVNMTCVYSFLFRIVFWLAFIEWTVWTITTQTIDIHMHKNIW